MPIRAPDCRASCSIACATQIEAIELPPGYSLEWGGEYEDSREARTALAKPLPLVLALMVFIVVCLFNSIRTTLLIWLIMPLAIIGVTVGLLLTGFPFGFMALLGVLALGGELIKNQIVVLSKILTEIEAGQARRIRRSSTAARARCDRSAWSSSRPCSA